MAEDRLSPQAEDGRNRIWGFGFIISVVVCVLLCAAFAVNPVMSGQSRGAELESRINPDIAPAASLVRLPGIGMGRATAILNWRTNSTRKEPNTPAFRNSNDLQNVRGIGPKTVRNISRWLKFE